MCGKDDQAVKEAQEGRGPAEGRCDLARGCICKLHDMDVLL